MCQSDLNSLEQLNPDTHTDDFEPGYPSITASFSPKPGRAGPTSLGSSFQARHIGLPTSRARGNCAPQRPTAGKTASHGGPPGGPSACPSPRAHTALPACFPCVMKNNRGQETGRGYYQLINQLGSSEGCGEVSEPGYPPVCYLTRGPHH